jgi:ribosomal silencing factor RsfS
MKDFEKFIIIFTFKNDRRINYQLQSLWWDTQLQHEKNSKLKKLLNKI